MASQAEVDLIISTADALPQLEQDLSRIINTAEDGAESIDIEATLEVQRSLAAVETNLRQMIDAAEDGADDVQLQAALDQANSLRAVNDGLRDLIAFAEANEGDIELTAELNEINSLAAIQAQLRGIVDTAEANAPPVELDVEIDEDRSGERGSLNLGRALSGILGPLARVSAGLVGVGLAAGSSASLLAATAISLQAIAPASALAVSGILTVQLAAGTLKLAMQGVGEAITTAFDPEAKPEDLAKAMEGLAPSARAFVTELSSMRKGFKELQQDVQQTFFQDLDGVLRDLGASALPVVSSAIQRTSQVLNVMAKEAGAAATQLAKDGTLGKALDSSVVALDSLALAPGQFVKGLGQIAAAAGPSLERVAAAAGDAATGISEKLSKAFESGALEEAISTAIDAIAQLGRIAGNVFEGLGNIIGTVSGETEGLFSILEKVTQAFADVTATEGFQQALKALAQTAGVLVDTVLPLIVQALQALGPVFQALGPPLQILIRALGDGLGKIIGALGPVLESLALAFGQLVIAVTPLINVAATLIAAILPILIPLFDALGQALNAIVPFIEQVAAVLIATLVPIFTTLATEVLPKILPPFIELNTKIFPILTSLLIALAPSLVKLAETFANLLVELTPVITELLNLGLVFAEELLPVIQPIIDIILKLVNFALGVLAAQISGLIIPILRILVNFLKGDFDAAWKGVEALIRNIKDKIVEILISMKDQAVANLSALARAAGEKAREIAQALVDRVRKGAEDVVANLQSLPGRAAAALAGSANALVSAGRDMVQGFINGISDRLGALRAKAQEIADVAASTVKNFLGIQSPSRVMMDVGNDVMAGLTLGIAEGIPDLRQELQGVAALAPSFALPNGQTLRLPDFSTQQPSVQVFIGNEEFNGHIDTRMAESNRARDRLTVTGVRR